MSTMSPFRAEPDAAQARAPTILVWDLPVRMFHWLMVACLVGAWLTAESERDRLLHLGFGYTMAGLVAFRLVWGLVGPRYARFAQFVRGPGAVLDHLRASLAGQPQHFTGHNPLGALAILLVLAFTALVAASGWMALNEIAGSWSGELHEGAASAMLAVVAVHLGGVLLASWQHRENLARAMLTGRKSGEHGEAGIGRVHAGIGVLLAAAVLAGWGWLLIG